MTDYQAVRVLELPGSLSGAFAGRLLRALGAEVTKLTDPDGVSTYPELDTGKALTQATAAPDPAQLGAAFDVVIKCGPAADLDAGPLGLGRLRAAHPGLITAAVTPFGESGPNAGHTGTDLIAIHAGGLGYGTPPRITDPESEHPLGIPGEAGQSLCGLVLVLGILNALAERDADGKGRHVEVSAQEAIASLMFNNIATYLEQGVSPGRLASERPNARRPFQPCADGNAGVMANRPSHVRAWLSLFGEQSEALVAQLDAGTPPGRLGEAIARVADEWTRERTRAEVAARAQAAHVPVEPVLTLPEVLACEQLEARGFWEESAPSGLPITGHPFGPIGDSDGPRVLPATVTWPKAEPWAGLEPGRGPLSGIRVVDFTWVFAGPIASRVLAAHGATVVKVEQPGGNEPQRPFLTRSLHGDKHSAALDLKNPADRGVARRLAESADIVIENFSTGVMERNGLGWQELRRANPRLIMVSISGMGRMGPYAGHVMFGQLAQGYSGLTSMIGYEGGPGRGIEDGGFWSDPVAGYSAAAATLAALREREVTGKGRRVDVSLVESTVSTLFLPLLEAARGGPSAPRGNFHPEMAPHDVYRCAPPEGDRWVAIAVEGDAEWRRLCEVIGKPELAAHPAYATLDARQARTRELRQVIEGWTNQRTPEEAAAALQARGVAATRSRTTADLAGDEHIRARGFFVTEGGAPVAVAAPWRLHPKATLSYGRAHGQGEDTDRVRASIA